MWGQHCDYNVIYNYLLHCPKFLDEGRTFLDNLQVIGKIIHDKNDSQISELLLFGVLSNNNASDTCILNPIIQYVLITWKLDFTVWIHMLTLPSPTKLHSIFNDNRLFVSFILLSLLF